MRVAGYVTSERDEAGVHTIDIWYSQRRRAWIVERLGEDGRHLGFAHVCASEADARDCVEHWLRTHDETVFVTPMGPAEVGKAVKRDLARRSTARAA